MLQDMLNRCFDTFRASWNFVMELILGGWLYWAERQQMLSAKKKKVKRRELKHKQPSFAG